MSFLALTAEVAADELGGNDRQDAGHHERGPHLPLDREEQEVDREVLTVLRDEVDGRQRDHDARDESRAHAPFQGLVVVGHGETLRLVRARRCDPRAGTPPRAR